MQPDERRKELAMLYGNLRSGNFNGATIQRFRQLVADEAKPQIEAATRQRQARAAVARARAQQRQPQQRRRP